MEFNFDINQLFSERVSILDQTLIAGRKSAGRPDLQAHIATVIDELGSASAKAQQLSAPITSASKLQTQRHQLYLLKDAESNGGRGMVVGFLKVGYKKLFLLDRQGVHIEAEPLCVLDFYISEKLQRHGYGLEIFNFMLQHKNLEPVLMAYDRPSPKFLSFLARHYCLTQSVPQVNNFVVFEGFFLNRSAAQLRKVPLRKPDGEIKPYSLMEREVVRQEQRVPPWPFAPPPSSPRSGSSQYSPSLSVGSSPSRAAQSPLLDRCRARRTSHQGLVARLNLYSRHLDTGAAGERETLLTGERAAIDHTPGHTDTHKLASVNRLQLLSPPAPPPSVSNTEDSKETQLGPAEGEEVRTKDGSQPQGGAEGRRGAGGGQREAEGEVGGRRRAGAGAEAEAEAGRRGVLSGQRGLWSWTESEKCFSAQWVKQKQQLRSTRPW